MSTPLTVSRAPSGIAHTAWRRPRPTDEPGIRFAIAEGVLVVATLVVATLGLGAAAAYVVLLGTALLAGLGLSARWTTALAASSWALASGFVEHGYGDLTLGGNDLVRLGVAVLAGAVVGVLSHAVVRRG